MSDDKNVERAEAAARRAEEAARQAEQAREAAEEAKKKNLEVRDAGRGDEGEGPGKTKP